VKKKSNFERYGYNDLINGKNNEKQ